MEISTDLVKHIAHLSRLEFEGQDLENIKGDLSKIIDFMAVLNDINTDGVEPLIFMSDEQNVLREDEAKFTISRDEALKNAPKKDSDYFRIPKVLNK